MPKKVAMEMPRIVSSPVISPELEKGPIALDTSWRSKMRSIGIIYATREGQTRKIAKHIAADLCRHGFDASVKHVHDEFASIDLSVYDTVILAASVHHGHLGPEDLDRVAFCKGESFAGNEVGGSDMLCFAIISSDGNRLTWNSMKTNNRDTC